MDSIYRVQRHFYDLTRKYYLLGRDRLIAELAPPADGHVIELGCGTARNLIAAARRYPKARFYGVDISAAMLETARANVAKAGFSDRILLAAGDASAFDSQMLFGRAEFDRVMISYALSMIPPWRETIDHAASMVAEGGSLHIVDFGSQERLPGAFKSGLRNWLRRFSVAPRDDLETVLGGVAKAKGLKLAFTRQFRGYAVYAVMRRGA